MGKRICDLSMVELRQLLAATVRDAGSESIGSRALRRAITVKGGEVATVDEHRREVDDK